MDQRDTPIQRLNKRQLEQQTMRNRIESRETNAPLFIDARDAYFKAGDPARRLERADSNLVQPDYTAMSNCPPEGYQTYFPGRPWIPNSRS